LETSNLPVEDIAVRSVRTAEYDEQRLSGPMGDLKGIMIIGQPRGLGIVRFLGKNED
jgi:hypothetical protein